MIATGTLVSGGSVGVIVMPWLFGQLLVQYGWRGSLLILGGLNTHLVAVGALLKPVNKTDSSEDIDENNQSPSCVRESGNNEEMQDGESSSTLDVLSRSEREVEICITECGQKADTSHNEDIDKDAGVRKIGESKEMLNGESSSTLDDLPRSERELKISRTEVRPNGRHISKRRRGNK